MTGWDILGKFIASFPPVAAVLFFLVAGIFFAIGFFRYGTDFIKHGFRQNNVPGASFEKRFDDLVARIDGLRAEFKTELETIKINHFGHLKNYLTELNGILLDKDVINNQDKARLDNQLRGM